MIKQKNLLTAIFFAYLIVINHVSATRLAATSSFVQSRMQLSSSGMSELLTTDDLDYKTVGEIGNGLSMAVNALKDLSNVSAGFKQFATIMGAVGPALAIAGTLLNIFLSQPDPVMEKLKEIDGKIDQLSRDVKQGFQQVSGQVQATQCIGAIQDRIQVIRSAFNKMKYFIDTRDQSVFNDLSNDELQSSFDYISNAIIANGQEPCRILDFLYNGGDQGTSSYLIGSTRSVGMFSAVMLSALTQAMTVASYLSLKQNNGNNWYPTNLLAQMYTPKMKQASQAVQNKLNDCVNNYENNMVRNLKLIFQENPNLSNVDQAYVIRDRLAAYFPEYGHFIQLWDDPTDGGKQGVHTRQGFEKLKTTYIRTKDYGFSQQKFIVLVSAEKYWTKQGGASDRAQNAMGWLFNRMWDSNPFQGQGDTPYGFVLWNNGQHLNDFFAAPYWIVGYAIISRSLNYVWADTDPSPNYRMNELNQHAGFVWGKDFMLSFWA